MFREIQRFRRTVETESRDVVPQDCRRFIIDLPELRVSFAERFAHPYRLRSLTGEDEGDG